MTHLFSIALSFLILLQSIGLHLSDIVQLDELIEHSQFHSEEYGDNFFVFVSKHYGELKAEHEKENQNEKEEHEQLPFQNQSHISCISAYFLDIVKTELNTPDFSEYTASIFITELLPLLFIPKGLFSHHGFHKYFDPFIFSSS